MAGLTGVIKFDHQGFRSDFVLDIVELNKDGLKKIGTWNSTEGVNFTRTYGEVYTQIVEILQNKTFVVTTILVSLRLRYSINSQNNCVNLTNISLILNLIKYSFPKQMFTNQ